MKKMMRLVLLTALLGVFACAATASAVDDLTTLVPKETSVVVRVRNLEQAWDTIRSSTFVANLRNTSVWQTLENQGAFDELRQGLQGFEQAYGTSVEESFFSVFGTDVVLAGNPQSKEVKAGVILFKGKPGFDMEGLYQKILDLEHESGEIISRSTEEYRDITVNIVERPKKDDPTITETHCAFFSDDIGALSNNLDTMKKVIDLLLDGPSQSIARSPVYERAEGKITLDTHVSLYANMNILTQDFTLEEVGKNQQGPAGEKIAEEAYKNIKAIDSLVLTGSVKEYGLQVKGFLLYDTVRLDAELKILEPSPRYFEVLDMLPDRTVLLASVKLDLENIFDFILASVDEEKRQEMQEQIENLEQFLLAGTDLTLLDDVIPNIGPEMSFAVTRQLPDAPGEKRFMSFVGMIQIKDTELLKKPIKNYITSLVGLINLMGRGRGEGGEKGPCAKMMEYKGYQIATFVPPKNDPLSEYVNPSVSLIDDMLVISSSPDVIEDAIDYKTGDATKQSLREFIESKNIAVSPAQLIGYVSLGNLAQVMEDNKEFFVNQSVSNNPEKTYEVTSDELTKAIEILKLFDCVYVSAQSSPSEISMEGKVLVAP